MSPTTPTLSIVTTCLNSADYLQHTIDSIRSQNGNFTLEYILIDGGSKDTTLDIIEANEAHITRWISEKDNGMYDAIAKGFDLSNGEIMGWLNSDDLYFPWTLNLIGRLFAEFPEVQWISTLSPAAIDSSGDIIKIRKIAGFSQQAFFDGIYVGFGGFGNPRASEFIQQESTFWRRSLWDQVVGSNIIRDYSVAGDFALWSAFMERAPLYGVESPLGAFRMRAGQLSYSDPGKYLGEANRALSIARNNQNYVPPTLQDDAPAQYTGQFLEQASFHDANAKWEMSEKPFIVLPRSDWKGAIFDGRVF